MRIAIVCLCLPILTALWSCGGDNPGPGGAEQERIQAYLDSMGINAIPDENGIYQWLIQPNTDPALNNSGDIFSIQYALYELGGGLIDSVSNSTQDTIVVLKQGAGAVYPVGIDLALNYLDAGQTRGFILPANVAYGSHSLTGISDNATILAEITLVNVRSEDDVFNEGRDRIDQYSAENLEDGMIPVRSLPQGFFTRIKTTRSGIAGNGVTSGDTVGISYIMRTLEGETIDAVGAADPFLFIVDGNLDIILGIREAVKEMELNERATLVIPSRAAYDYSVAVIPHYLIDNEVVGAQDNPLITENIIPDYATRIPPYEIILVELELVSIN